MFVGCKLPHGMIVDFGGQTITLNGSNTDYDPDSPWKNGLPPDSPLRTSAVGLTEVTGDAEAALREWLEIASKGEGPVRAGLIFAVDKKVDANREAQALEGVKTGLDGLDPDKDLPAGIETDTEATKKKG